MYPFISSFLSMVKGVKRLSKIQLSKGKQRIQKDSTKQVETLSQSTEEDRLQKKTAKHKTERAAQQLEMNILEQ